MSFHRVKRSPAQLSPRHELWIYLAGAAVFLSGVGWLVAHYFLAVAGEFGETRHASEPWWLRLHGGAAMLFLIAFGSLFPRHIVPGWRKQKNRGSGVSMIALVSLLILTGYALYYLGGEQSRAWISAIHWTIGVACGGGFWLHAWLGKKSAKVPANP